MKYIAQCPKCYGEFAVTGLEAGKSGLNCPHCGNQFTTDTIKAVAPQISPELGKTPEEVLLAVKKMEKQERVVERSEPRSDAARLRSQAVIALMFGCVFVAVSVLMILFGAFNEKEIMIRTGCWIFWPGVVLCIISQQLHIRAA